MTNQIKDGILAISKNFRGRVSEKVSEKVSENFPLTNSEDLAKLMNKESRKVPETI